MTYDMNECLSSGFGFRDQHGKPVKRNKYTHPYSYDAYVLWQTKGKSNGAVYSDRLLQWDWDKHNDLCRKHFGNEGQYWNGRKPAKVEAFLRDYFSDPTLKLVMIMEGCNVSNGYPYWVFLYHTESEATS